ncbi:MAG: hypothetical protein QM660_12945 [Dysgonomonas sp.]
MDNKFNEKDSLQVINEMIAQTRNNIQIGAANPMIFCGYFVAIVAICNIILLETLDKPYYSFWIWLLMIPMSLIERCFISRKKNKSAIVRTPIDRIISKIWIGFACCIVVLLISIFSLISISDNWIFTILITPVILTLTGFGQFISGYATRFAPFVRGAYVFWVGAVLAITLAYGIFNSQTIQFIILAVCMIVGFVIPGHILNRKAKENV